MYGVPFPTLSKVAANVLVIACDIAFGGACALLPAAGDAEDWTVDGDMMIPPSASEFSGPNKRQITEKETSTAPSYYLSELKRVFDPHA